MKTTTAATSTASTSAKLLLPLATLAAAGAVAVGSGATWTSENTSISTSVTGGDIAHTNTKDGMTLAIGLLKPGVTETGTLTIENTGDLDSLLSLKETSATNGFAANMLNLTITAGSTEVFNGNFGAMSDNVAYNIPGVMEPGDTVDVTVSVSLSADSTNVDQTKTAGASFQFVTTQTTTDDETTNDFS